jgi:hypothetical protein
MPLTAAELDVVHNLAYPLPTPALRAAFTTAVANALEAYPVHDVGLAYRLACQFQRDFFTPPRVTGQSQFFNSRKHSRAKTRSTETISS